MCMLKNCAAGVTLHGWNRLVLWKVVLTWCSSEQSQAVFFGTCSVLMRCVLHAAESQVLCQAQTV
jgi:hypothetical protein